VLQRQILGQEKDQTMTLSSTTVAEGKSFHDSSPVDFLQWLRPGGPYLLVAIHPDSGAITATTATSAEAVMDFVGTWNGQRNLYYSLNPTLRSINKKPRKADIAAIEFVPGDFDPNNGETPADGKARYRAALATFRPPPSAIVDSGNGLQGLWRLAQPIELNETTKDIAKDIEARGKALLIALGGKPGTQNFDRLLRLPGTINLPNATKRAAGRVQCLATVVEMNGALCTPEQLPMPAARGRPRSAGTGTSSELPQQLRIMLHLTGEQPAGYPSRSELFWAFINAALRASVDENRIVEECLSNSYAGCSICEHVLTNGGESYVRQQIENALNEPEPANGDKRLIRLRDGNLDNEHRMTTAALAARQCPVFVRGGRLVQPLWRWKKTGEGDKAVLSAALVPYNLARLRDMIQHHAVLFQKYNKTESAWHNVNPPERPVNAIIDMGHWGHLGDVVGFITSPTMRSDGSLITAPGYDAATQLWYKPTDNIELPPIGTTRDDAMRALADLKELIKECAFDADQDRSVALAAMMTVVLRAAFPRAPLFFISKPEAGTGGTYLVKIISTLALGREAVPLNVTDDKKEFVKELSAAAFEGGPILNLNNLAFDLESSLLAQMVTEGEVSIRPFGKNTETVLCDCRVMTVIANTNNKKLIGELVRRAVMMWLDTELERPEIREYEGDPIAMIKRDRGKYLASVFTIVRAFMNAKPTVTVERMNGFEGWSQWVRKPLVWLGEPDPGKSQEEARTRDPERGAARQRIMAIVKHFRAATKFTAKDIFDKAMELGSPDASGRPKVVNPDLLDAFATSDGKPLSTRSIGRYLSSDERRRAGEYHIKLFQSDEHGHAYQVLPRPPAQGAAPAEAPVEGEVEAPY
jgi:putative DNA primase/helicase